MGLSSGIHLRFDVMNDIMGVCENVRRPSVHVGVMVLVEDRYILVFKMILTIIADHMGE